MWGMGKGGGMDGGKGGMMNMMMNMMMMKGMMGGGKGKGWEGGKGWGKDKGKPARGPGSWGPYKCDDSGGILGEYVGTVKSFNARTGYGFIESPDIQAMGYRDVFMHGDMRKEFDTGDKVKFTAFLTSKGELQCKDLQAP
eukprot:TRINITY_DN1029_c0_g2_i1.p1 TRINITY_DN1029_c0_g2~~TRINITY_DN1029_c0_g2_i1.p1  ORF type:complete len:140 (-),score=59.21 TRINITY_DN1029_c0_g2_i1:226-645(-)